MSKYKIEKDSVQETLLIPLLGRKVCSDKFPHLFKDDEVDKVMNSIDYDFEDKKKLMSSFAGTYGALEVAQRQYDLSWEVLLYLKDHPKASVVNMGCGLDTTFYRIDNGECKGYNLDFPDVIEIRNKILPPRDREYNIPCDLNDHSWFKEIDKSNGVIFFASGVFYYFKKEDALNLFLEMSKEFKGSSLVFDTCNQRGLKMMLKTWIKEAGIKDVGAYFAVKDPIKELTLNEHFKVSYKSYMRGYRNIDKEINIIYRLMNSLCDNYVNANITKIEFI